MQNLRDAGAKHYPDHGDSDHGDCVECRALQEDLDCGFDYGDDGDYDYGDDQ
jgi:hypothetical protein